MLGRCGHSRGRRWRPCAVGCGASWRSRRPGCLGRRRRRRGRRRRPGAGATGPPGGPPAAATPGPARPGRRRSAPPGLGRPARPPPRPAAPALAATCPNTCSSPWPQPIKPTAEGKHLGQIVEDISTGYDSDDPSHERAISWARGPPGPPRQRRAHGARTTPTHRARREDGARSTRPTVPGKCMGPKHSTHRAGRVHGSREPRPMTHRARQIPGARTTFSPPAPSPCKWGPTAQANPATGGLPRSPALLQRPQKSSFIGTRLRTDRAARRRSTVSPLPAAADREWPSPPTSGGSASRR
jgi:hypothetical protein